jgi:chemotaxis protein MotB
MAFFMVMYAMSQVDSEKFKQLAASLSSAFSNPGGRLLNIGSGDDGRIAIIPRNPKETSRDPNAQSRRRSIEEVKGEFTQLIKEGGLETKVTVTTSPDGHRLIVRLSDSVLFPAGSADLSEQAKELLGEVADILVKAGRPVSIEGHTDNIPTKSGRYESNWQLSTARATNVLMYLIESYGMPPEKLSASGYGEYRPIASNDTPEGKAANRRVEVVIVDEDK